MLINTGAGDSVFLIIREPQSPKGFGSKLCLLCSPLSSLLPILMLFYLRASAYAVSSS